MSVDQFLQSIGYSLKTGYLGQKQKEQFQKRLSELVNIRSVAEVGFHAGHSAECFFESLKSLELFVSFDINQFPFTQACADYFKTLHPERFFFVAGNSLEKVPEFVRHVPLQKFDLIYIDGNHSFEAVVGDISSTQKCAHADTVLWLDDSHMESVKKAIHFCKTLGMIEVLHTFSPHDDNDPERSWVEARYCNHFC